MKKSLLLIAAFLLAACSQIQTPSDSILPTEIEFSVKMDSFATKATDTAFENGDEMNLLVMWGEKAAGLNNIDIRKATYQDGEITLDKSLYWPEKPGWEEANFIMMYPYMEGYTEENILDFIGGEVFFTVKADQSTHALYTSSDLIAGGCYELQEEDVPCTVNITLAHMLSQVRIIITNKSEFGIKDVYLSDVYGTFEINRERTSGSKGIIKTCHSGNGQWTCVVPPQTGEPKIHITTTDNREIVFKAPSEIEFPQSVRTNLLLTLNDNAEASDFSYEIANWDPGQDFNFSQNEWKSLGTGWICDQWFGNDSFQVEFEQNKDNPRSFRLVNPYSGIKQAYYSTSSAVPDEYLYFRIIDKGELIDGQTVTRDNFVYFEPYRTGYHYSDEKFDANINLTHPSDSDFPIYRWNTNRTVRFQDNGLPGEVGLSPIYKLDDSSGWDYDLNHLMVRILFPGCYEYKSYTGSIVLSDDIGYGRGIIKENGKTYLSFRIEKTNANVSSMKFTILDGWGYSYSDIFDLEDGLIDSQTVTGEGKDILYEIPDNYAYHDILMETYGDGYPQEWLSYTTHDTSKDNAEWIACGKGTYDGYLGVQSNLILYNSRTDDLKYKISPWQGDCLPFSWDNEYDNTIEIEYGYFTGVYTSDYAPIYVSEYSIVHPYAEPSKFLGRSAFYFGEGQGLFEFNPYYYTNQGPFHYGYIETFQLTGSETNTKAQLILKSTTKEKKSERANLEDFSEGGVNPHLHSGVRPKNLQKMPE